MKDYLFVLLLSSFRPGVEEEVQCRIIGKEKKEESVVGLYLLISFGRRIISIWKCGGSQLLYEAAQ